MTVANDITPENIQAIKRLLSLDGSLYLIGGEGSEERVVLPEGVSVDDLWAELRSLERRLRTGFGGARP